MPSSIACNARRSRQRAQQQRQPKSATSFAPATAKPARESACDSALPVPPVGEETTTWPPTLATHPIGLAEGETPGSAMHLSQEAHHAAVDITAILLRAALDRRRVDEANTSPIMRVAEERADEEARPPVLENQRWEQYSGVDVMSSSHRQ